MFQDSAGGGSIKIDNRKAAAIKSWMERCSPAVLSLVEVSQHDIPFNAGPFGESLAMVPWLFLDSTSPVALSANAGSGLAALDGEAVVSVDWLLTMTPEAQIILFERIQSDFNSATALVEVRAKKKYRAAPADLVDIRNTIVLWTQVRGLCEHSMDANDFQQKLASGNLVDDQIAEILVQRPNSFAVSMLPSQRAQMQKAAEAKEQAVCSEVETQRVELRNARFQFLKAALLRDQVQLQRLEAVPTKLAALQRRVEAKWREEEAYKGERAVQQYCNKYLRVERVDKIEFIVGPFRDFVTFVVLWRGLFCNILSGGRGTQFYVLCQVSVSLEPALFSIYMASQAKLHNVPLDRVHIVAYCDFNVPNAASRTRTQDLAKAMHMVLQHNASRNVGLADFPDAAKASSKRGLADEEADIQTAFWSMKLNLDNRFVLPFDLHPSGESLAKRRTGVGLSSFDFAFTSIACLSVMICDDFSLERRWSMGRLVVPNELVDDNVFLNCSELSTAGRPMYADKVLLPRQRDLVLPESTDASSDLRLAERARPSPEQLRAQKGRSRVTAMLRSLLTMSEYTFDGPVVLVNFTGYVEDVGLSVARLIPHVCFLYTCSVEDLISTLPI